MIAFLKRTSGGQAPAPVLESIQRWESVSTRVWLEQMTVLRVADPEILVHLRSDSEIGPLLADVVDAHSVLVEKDNVRQVRRWLARHNYL